ncbi:MAG: hypothetical protein ABI687_09325 [Flavitalea sp.]
MNTLTVILGINVTVGLPEIIIFLVAAILLGFSIHFYWSGRKIAPPDIDAEEANASRISESDEWRLEFYEQIEQHEKTKELLEKEIANARNNEKTLVRQMDELQNELNMLERDIANRKESQDLTPTDYITELVHAQQNLQDHNQQISRLLQQLDHLKEAERKNIEILKSNDTLNTEIRELRHLLSGKESEIRHIQQRQLLSKEMNERLEQAHEEFKFLKDKLQKLEGYVGDPQARNYEYDELQQSYFRLTKECDEIKLRNLSLLEDNQLLARSLADAEEKLRESSFQRQQLSKKVSYLEELTTDLQQVSGHNKKLESQLRRINEIETMLTKVSVENRK